ncbi:MAG: DUF485 domain-containing protein [Pseudomonas sp.]
MDNNNKVYEKVYADPRFQDLVAKRGSFAWTLSIVMLAAYYSFILVIAFNPKLLGTPISEGSVITLGLPVGLGLIFLCFVLTGIYVQRANGEFDRITQEIIDEAQK